MPKFSNPDFLNIQKRNIFNTMGFPEFQKKLSEVFDEEWKCLQTFQYIIGGRPAELPGLQRKHFDLTQKKDYIVFRMGTVKEGWERLLVIPVCNPETEALKAWIAKKFPEEYIFPSLARLKDPKNKFYCQNRTYKIGREHDGVFYPASAYFFRHNIMTLLNIHGIEEKLGNYFQGKPLIASPWGSSRYYVHANLDYAMKIGVKLKKILKSTANLSDIPLMEFPDDEVSHQEETPVSA